MQEHEKAFCWSPNENKGLAWPTAKQAVHQQRFAEILQMEEIFQNDHLKIFIWSNTTGICEKCWAWWQGWSYKSKLISAICLKDFWIKTKDILVIFVVWPITTYDHFNFTCFEVGAQLVPRLQVPYICHRSHKYFCGEKLLCGKITNIRYGNGALIGVGDKSNFSITIIFR